MILVAVGANLPAAGHATPRATVEAAVTALADEGVRSVRRSRWYRSAADPPSSQPDFVNGVLQVETDVDPAALLDCLHGVEAAFGRQRRLVNEARSLDLDLLDYHGRVSGGHPVLPHPRLHRRNFVLLPLAEVAPDWRHPVSRRPVAELIARLKGAGGIEVCPAD